MAEQPELEKRLRALRKKLSQIERLKEKDLLDAAEREKVASEPALLQEIAALEAEIENPGATFTPAPRVTEAVPPPPEQDQDEAMDSPEAPKEQLSPAEAEKRIKALKKKLQQIERLKEKGDDLDADAREKVASEAAFLEELAQLEGGGGGSSGGAGAGAAKASSAPVDSRDPHAAARAKALEPPSGDLGLLLDDETEKKFKALQKKLRDIGKLHEQDKLDKLQVQKLTAEPGLIEEIAALRAKADAVLLSRRREPPRPERAEAPRPERVEAPRETGKGEGKAAGKGRSKGGRATAAPQGDIAWECPNCGAAGRAEDLTASGSCPKCGYDAISHRKPVVEEEDEEEDAAAAAEAKARRAFESKDLKTARQRQQPAAAKKDGPVVVGPDSACWPEVKECLESGDRGVDKARQKKAIAIDQAKGSGPYAAFDSALLKCSFLTRVELKLPEGVLAHDNFMLYFPGQLNESLVELILKGNALPRVPPGLQDLHRIRSIDLSHNAIDVLPGPECWQRIEGTLELLDLSFNKLSSIQSLGSLTKLSQLKVDANGLTSLDGVAWSKLKQLVTLSAAQNKILEIPEEMGDHAATLENLELSGNSISVLPPNMSELKKLKFFGLEGNPIKDQKALKAHEKGVKDLKTYLSKLKPGKK